MSNSGAVIPGRGPIGAGLLLGALVLTGCERPGPAFAQATIDSYCVDCHNAAELAGGLNLAALDLGDPLSHAESWEFVVKKLRAGMMPPAEARPLTTDDRAQLIAGIEGALDAAAAAAPYPGRTVAFHRLNRNEYSNVVRDVLGVDIDVSELLPADDSSYGFDNIAGVLKVSPTLMERYLQAAERISRLAVGRPSRVERIDYFRVADDRSQERRLPGLPFGTRGGIKVSYTFPVDGEYDIAASLARDLNEQVPLYEEEQHLEVSVDGARVALFTLPAVPIAAPTPPPAATQGDEEPAINQITRRLSISREGRDLRNRIDDDWHARVNVTAGQHDVVVTFLARTAALDESARLPFLRPYPAGVNIPETRTGAYLRSIEISGPYGEIGGAESLASRDQLYVCEPVTAVDGACAEQILRRLSRLAYRRPVDAADLDPLLAVFREGAQDAAAGGDDREGVFAAGLQLALKRLLVSPSFLYRMQLDPPGAPDIFDLSDVELASRLSFFLWSSAPDEALLGLAESGQLNNDEELDRQVRRMLADPRAEAFVENFAGQWLFLRNLDATVPVQSNFPDFDDTLRQGLRRETELFFASILSEDHSALDLLTADYTFLNERVARHYGMTQIKGSHFRRVELPPESGRRGLLGQGSILAVTSYPDRTSPVIRGKWVLENLLGTPPPNPPPNVPGLVETDGAGSALAMRERLAQHRANPNCASCHALMDPLGFALEQFDAIGRSRTLGDAGEVLDASGELPDGTRFSGADGLRDALLASDVFVRTLTEKLMTYALGRGVEPYDMPTLRQIVAAAAGEDYRMSALIGGIVKSMPFRQRAAVPLQQAAAVYGEN